MLTADGAEHARLRRPVQPFFTAEALESYRPRVQAVVDRLVDDVARQEELDAVEDVARPLSAMVLADLLGVPGRDFGRFHGWARLASANLDPLAPVTTDSPATRAADELATYLEGRQEAARASPRPCLLGRLAGSAEVAGSLRAGELAAFATLAVIGGYEPLADLVANGLLMLLSERAAWEGLVVDPTSASAAVEELLRLDPPIQLAARVATEDLTVAGTTVSAGQGVVCLLGAANRDPAPFNQPDDLRSHRRPNPHLAFGAGPHFCLGAPLTRLVGQVALATMAARWPALALVTGPPDWRLSIVPRGLRTLVVRPAGLRPAARP